MAKLPDGIVQELCLVLAVHCREICMIDNSDGEKQGAQDLFMEKVFHGTEAYASNLDLLISGEEPYTSLYEFQELENNREGNEHRSGQGFMLELKEIFHCDTGKYA